MHNNRCCGTNWKLFNRRYRADFDCGIEPDLTVESTAVQLIMLATMH